MNYDVLIGLDEGALNRALTTIYARPGVRQKLFQGSGEAKVSGLDVKLDWSLGAAPIARLNPPSEVQWAQAIASPGGSAHPVPNTFVLELPQLTIQSSVQMGGTVPVGAICSIGLSGGQIGFQVVAALVDLSGASDADKTIYQQLVIPQALAMVSQLLAHQYLPSFDFRGLHFNAAQITVGSGRAFGGATLAGNPNPVELPAPADLPAKPFCVLLSPRALDQVANDQAKGLVGHIESSKGSKSAVVASAGYEGQIRIESVEVSFGQDPTQVNGRIGFSASANAGISVLGGAVVAGVTEAAEKVSEGVTHTATKVAEVFKSY